jgi:uncharacterized membrane protein
VKKPTPTEVRWELLLLAGVVLVALVSPLAFDMHPVNLISTMFVTVYVASRIGQYLSRSR